MTLPKKAPREPKSKPAPLLVKARQLRQNLRARAKKNGIDPQAVPSADILHSWLRSEEPFTCHYFGTLVKLKDLNVDHKNPISEEGSNDIENLCITSRRTNKAKGAFSYEEWLVLTTFCEAFPEGGRYLISRLISGFMVSRRKVK
jgi:5-methylcytosine-specific restriction endonuclease McrA